MKPICLITPPSPFLLDERVFMSLGILRVGAVLEQAGHAVEHLDLTGISNYEEALIDHATRTEAAIFGLTATTPQMPAAARVAAALRSVRPDARLILGGPHVTLVNAALKREKRLGIRGGRAERACEALSGLYDVLVTGDGEHAVHVAILPSAPKLIDADDASGPLFLTNETLNALPWPARHLVDVGSYHYEIAGERALSLIAQLGCPFGCGFCGGRESSMLRRIRTRTTENVVAEIEHLYLTYGVRAFMCYDDATEVLTQTRGFVPFRDLLWYEAIAILEPETGEMRFEVPRKQIVRRFDGNLVRVKGKSVDLVVTPEHRMWIKTRGARAYRHVNASEMLTSNDRVTFLQSATWSSREIPCFSIPAYEVQYLGRGKGSPKVQRGERAFEADLWIRFMAWYLAEGSCYRPNVRNGRGYRICIKQHGDVNEQNCREIRSILDGLEYRYSYSSNQFHIDSRELYEYLVQFGKARDKHVPQEFKAMSARQCKLFVDTYAKGDGSVSRGQRVIASYSERMQSDLQELAIKGGYWATVSGRRVVLRDQGEVTTNDHRHGTRARSISEEHYAGDVHCVTVSTGIILVRRCGRPVWCGNCYDDELNVNKQMVGLMKAIAAAQKRLRVEWKLRGFIKSQLFTDEQAEAMHEAGFRWILVGFESGSPRILENINKRATREENSRCMEIARNHSLKVKALMSIGHPGESRETIAQTWDWLIKERPDDFDITIITTYPGTPYYDEAEPMTGNPGVWTYTAKSGDRLHAHDLDFTTEQAYYKGVPGEYQSFVFTDFLSAEELVEARDHIEADVRKQLCIEWNVAHAAARYEHSMGQGLPDYILRASTGETARVQPLGGG